MTTNIEDLQAAAAAARAVLEEAEAAARAETERRELVIADAQTLHHQHTVDNGRALDDRLAAEYTAHYQAALDAIAEGDLLTAFREFTGYKTLGITRYLTRVEVQNAAAVLGVPPYTSADYTDRSATWDEFLSRAIETSASNAGRARAEAEIPPAPDAYDEALALLDTE